MKIQLRERRLCRDIVTENEAEPAKAAELLLKFEIGEFWKLGFSFIGRNVHPNDTRRLEKYVDALRENGLDIVRGEEFEFGYKMPVPEKDATCRYLEIFRRKNEEPNRSKLRGIK